MSAGRFQSLALATLFFLLLLIMVLNAPAANYSWNGGSGPWSIAANWTPTSGPPGPGDTAAVVSGTVFVISNTVVANLDFSGGTITGTADLTVQTNLAWTGGVMSGSGKTILASKGMMNVTSDISIYRVFQNDGTVTWTGGVLGMSGSIENNGSFTASSSGALTCRGENIASAFNNNASGTFTKLGTGDVNFVVFNTGVAFNNSGVVDIRSGKLITSGIGFQMTSGLLRFGISNTNVFGKLQANAAVTLAGGVDAVLLNGFVPPTNSSYQVMTFPSHTGSFTNTGVSVSVGDGRAVVPTLSAASLTLDVVRDIVRITNILATATSELAGLSRYASNAVNGVYVDGSFWESVGVGQGFGEDRAPAITFDLRGLYRLDHFLIWNSHEPGPDIKRMVVEYSLDGVNFASLGQYNLAPGTATTTASGNHDLTNTLGRYVRFSILENYAGQIFPVVGSPTANSLIAIDEVEFYGEVAFPSTQSITFGPLPDRREGDAPFVISATADSGSPVTFSTLTPSVVTVSGSQVTIVGPGTAIIRASQPGNAGYLAAAPVDRSFAVGPRAVQPFGLTREVYTGIPGLAVSNLIASPSFPNFPATVGQIVDFFETLPGVGDNYGQRVRGYLIPPATGNYIFWISSDDASELYLSTDNLAVNKRLIASQPTWTNLREWTKQPSQQSVTIPLQADLPYYVEALMKNGGGGDHLSVGWKLPDTTLERPTPASRLRPFDAANPPQGRADLSVSQTSSPSSVKIGNNLTFTLAVSNAGPSQANAVFLTNTLSANANLVGVQSSQGTIGGTANQLVFDLGSLPVGGVVDINLIVTPTAAGVLSSTLFVVANEFDPDQSNNLSVTNVTVPGPPVINPQPQGATIVPGGAIALSVGTFGPGSFQYQWRLNGVNLPGQTSATYNVASAQFKDGGAYSVVVSSAGGVTISSPALIQFNIASTAGGDLFANRVTLPGDNGSLRGANTAATFETNEPLHAGKPGGKSVWYVWHPTASGVATLSTVGSTFDTLLAIYQGTVVAALTPVVADDDSGGTGTSLVKFNVVANGFYQIAVDGHGGESGDFILAWNLEPTLDVLPAITQQPTALTLTNGGVGALTVVATGNGLTYQWFKNGLIVNSATAATLNFPNFSANDVGNYFVRITADPQRTVDSFIVSVELGTDPNVQSQDKFEDLFVGNGTAPAPNGQPRRSAFTSVAAGALGTQIFSSVGSATQAGEPSTGGASGGASRWFYLKPTSSGVMIIDTIGSTYDTIMSVSTGPSLFSLTPVASDDNGAPDGIRSRVRFDAVSGQQYYVAVDGVGGATGTVYLNYGLGTAPVITASPVSSTNLVGASVTLNGAATGVAAPSYQWRRSGTNLIGSTSATLPLGAVTSAQAGTYTLVASNFVGAIVSQPAVLTVATIRSFATGSGAPGGGLSFSNGIMRFTLTGGGYGALVIDASTNLVNWVPLVTNPVSASDYLYLDPSSNRPVRFYRAREVR